MIVEVVRRGFIGIGAAWVMVVGIGCQTPGYRTEVYPGQEGHVEIKRVPDDTPAPRPPGVSSDTDLATIQSLWPRLTPDDRQRVADMARRLAETQK